MIRRIGGHTLGFEEMPSIIGYASVAGKKESEGPLGKGFDKIIYDSYNGKNTYEQAESTLQFTAVETAMQKAGVKAEDKLKNTSSDNDLTALVRVTTHHKSSLGGYYYDKVAFLPL